MQIIKHKFKFKNVLAFSLASSLIAISTLSNAAEDKPWQSIGRKATTDEVKAWDIDVRGDFKGIPKGQGSVAQGEHVWEGKCASCHGSFGELNEVFPPLVGGTTEEDIKNGVVAANAKGGVAQKTTLMKLARLSTMWDYINRAMPWNAPKSLTHDEVYAVTAYILNLGGIIPSDFTLSDKNIAKVQERLPNRNGLVRFDGLWDVKGKPDVKNVACMSNCEVDQKLTSFLPDFARNAHGNLAEQNRVIGAVRGTDTSKPAPQALEVNPSAKKNAGPELKEAAKPLVASDAAGTVTDVKQLLAKNTCTACHGIKNKIVGPGFNEIAAKYKGKADLENYLVSKIKTGGSGVWGAVPMPPQAQLKDADAKAIAQWLSLGAK
ncbi:MAG: c-type cytochrome [Undibacterium sp.]|uniref:c-type cytochrome n=1 Tax=Undibacterium sp. TaxID=1914977 RepID=UPI00271EAE11|nr:c-type cytochrome [Undibacterium sp.]MDO8650632.1 c-type cytochrome [Undibacterium sp.]